MSFHRHLLPSASVSLAPPASGEAASLKATKTFSIVKASTNRKTGAAPRFVLFGQRVYACIRYLLKECYDTGTGQNRQCYEVLRECFGRGAGVLRRCYGGLTGVLHGLTGGVTGLLPEWYGSATQLFPRRSWVFFIPGLQPLCVSSISCVPCTASKCLTGLETGTCHWSVCDSFVWTSFRLKSSQQGN